MQRLASVKTMQSYKVIEKAIEPFDLLPFGILLCKKILLLTFTGQLKSPYV